jgi:hypothetical protein
MEFFNQKEEVLDLVLTKRGKELFSQGKFKPYGYKFFDNETVYEAGTDEVQNSIVARIKQTPYLKQEIPANFIPSKVNASIAAPFGFINNCDLVNELGQSDQFTEYAPSWNIEFLESSASFASPFLSASILGSSKTDERIPQFNVTVGYKAALVYTYYDRKSGKYYYTEDYKDKFNYVQLILQRDTDDVFVKASENNSFLPTEKQELTFELYKYFSANGAGQELQKINLDPTQEESYSKYFTILFDDVAEQSNKFNTKNIYGEPETENVCE